MTQNATVTQVMIDTYESTLIQLSQRMNSKIQPWVMQRGEESAGHNWPRLAKSEANLKTNDDPGAGFSATPMDGTVFSERRSVPLTYHKGELVKAEDIVQTLIDPLSGLAQAQIYGLMRSYDQEILDAAERDADDGNGGVVTAPTPINDGGATSITFDIVTQVTEAFLNNDVDPEEPKVWFASPAQIRKLLQLTEMTSADYNSLRPLEAGMPTNWMGYTWIPFSDLNSFGAGRTTSVVMTADAIGFNINEGVTTRVAEDPTQSFDWRVYCRSTFGAVRVQDEKIFTVDLSETI